MPSLAAVKTIAIDSRNHPELWQRCVRDAEQVIRVSHDAVVAMLGIGTVGRKIYVASEIVVGRTIAQIADRSRKLGQRVPLPAAISIAADLLSGLAHLPRAHGEITANNVFVDHRGRGKIGDFGMVHALPFLLDPTLEHGGDDVTGIASITYRLLVGRVNERERVDLPGSILGWLQRMMSRPADPRGALEQLEAASAHPQVRADRESAARWMNKAFGDELEIELEEIARGSADDTAEHEISGGELTEHKTDLIEIGTQGFDEETITHSAIARGQDLPTTPSGFGAVAVESDQTDSESARDPKVATVVLGDDPWQEESASHAITRLPSSSIVPSIDTGRYEIIERIAEGGMAVIHRAREYLPGGGTRECALKMIAPAHRGRKEFEEMLAEEGRISKLLDHPNIVRCYDTGVIDGSPYIAFELVVGGTELDRWIATKAPKPLPLSISLQFGVDIAKALDYAHRLTGRDGKPLQLVHRDVSPQNILISGTGELKLLDFGISRFSERDHETKTGLVKGKLTYMAPEQINGQIVDQRTDLFQLGLVLAETIAGKKLSPPKPHWIAAHVPDLRPVLEQHFAPIGGVPGELLELLVRMTAREPAKRPANASIVLRELRHLRERA